MNRLLRWIRGQCLRCGGPKVDWARHSSCDVCPRCDLTASDVEPQPIKDPDYDAIRKKVVARFTKTLAYLAKHNG